MEKVFISGCVMGEKVRYDGKAATRKSHILDQWRAEGRIITACPEMAGGLPTPRKPSEIQGQGDGRAVFNGTARVIMNDGTDVTGAFIRGAQHALKVCQDNDIRVAVLKEKSPSCGVAEIYDGSFTGAKTSGMGTTAALLRKNGIAVFSDEDIESAEKHIRKLERNRAAPSARKSL